MLFRPHGSSCWNCCETTGGPADAAADDKPESQLAYWWVEAETVFRNGENADMLRQRLLSRHWEPELKAGSRRITACLATRGSSRQLSQNQAAFTSTIDVLKFYSQTIHDPTIQRIVGQRFLKTKNLLHIWHLIKLPTLLNAHRETWSLLKVF